MKIPSSISTGLIRFEHVTFGYDRGNIFKDLNLSIKPGEMIGVVGPNGSGKSTLIKLIAGILKPEHGDVFLNDRPVSEFSMKQVAQQMAYVPQRTSFALPFKVLDIVLMGRYPYHRIFSFETVDDIRIAREKLAVTGSDHLENRFFEELSGGEQQRVILASALAQEPSLILLDEPTASLDLHYQLHLFDVLARMNQEKQITVITAVHDLNLAARYCRRILLIHGNHAVEDSDTESVLNEEKLSSVFKIGIRKHIDPETGWIYFLPRQPIIEKDG